MKEKLNQLVHLQDCDSRLQEILKRKNKGPLKIEQLEKDLLIRKQEFEEDQDQLNLLKKQRKDKEEEVQDIDLNLKKSQSKLTDIKNNKEYQAALKEIDNLKRQQMAIEDEILILMEQIEEMETKCSLNEQTKKELQTKYEQTKEEILKDIELLDREYNEINKEKSSFCNSIEKDLLNRYSYLKDRMGGIAIGPVINGICQACHMGIPPQRFNELRRGNTLLFCPNCQRIIYWAEDEYYKENHF